MRRAYIKRSTKPLKRKTRLKRFSPKGAVIKRCEDIIKAILKIELGAKCQICGKPEEMLAYSLSLFHILDKNKYPRIRLHKRNLLLVCWSPIRYVQNCFEKGVGRTLIY